MKQVKKMGSAPEGIHFDVSLKSGRVYYIRCNSKVRARPRHTQAECYDWVTVTNKIKNGELDQIPEARDPDSES